MLLLSLFCRPLPFLILREYFPADDVIVLRPEYLILDEFGRAVVLSAIEMRQFLDELVHVVLAGCI